MELDEAIKHCKDKAKELRKEKHIMALIGREQEWADCLQCAEEHEQLAEWLKDYKRLKALEDRPTGKWIPRQYRLWHHAYECSICGNVIDTDDFGDGNFSYCDKCGAKMEKEAEDE